MSETGAAQPQTLRDSSPEVDAWFAEDDWAKECAGWKPKWFDLDANRLVAVGFAAWGALLAMSIPYVLLFTLVVFQVRAELTGWWAGALVLGGLGAWLAFHLFQEASDGSTGEWAPSPSAG